ncbi:ATP-binding protein [Flavobacteriaceae bacterium LMO-SS05]
MKIKTIKLKNFRSYKEEVLINIDDLTVFVGKNDIGKSTVLEALDIFFNEYNKEPIKMDKDDVNKEALKEGNDEIIISVVFEDYPDEITIDATNPTNLKDEYLLNSDDCLEIIKKYKNGGKDKVFIKAKHPTNTRCSDLLLKKQTELRKIIEDNGIECENRNRNAVMRKAIWDSVGEDLELEEIEIDASKEDAKNTWEKLKDYLPLYALFQSDRKNSDGDNEVQDPLKFAVEEILKDASIIEKLKEVAEEVENKLKEVANATLDKLKEMNPDIAESLDPVIPSPETLKWKDVFKSVTISGDEGIPINKRGSGVKRLILLNFFRAQAERRKSEGGLPTIVYGIEEPETSQHTEHQKMLIRSFVELSCLGNTQLLLTTHSPMVVKELGFSNLRLITIDDKHNKSIKAVEAGHLPYPSLNEINYSAFGEITEEYHNELFEHLKAIHAEDVGIKRFDQDYFQAVKGEPNNCPWMTSPNQISIHTHVRNQIHHRADCGVATFEDLSYSIGKMREFIIEEV